VHLDPDPDPDFNEDEEMSEKALEEAEPSLVRTVCLSSDPTSLRRDEMTSFSQLECSALSLCRRSLSLKGELLTDMR
jgi:hypothetical protein